MEFYKYGFTINVWGMLTLMLIGGYYAFCIHFLYFKHITYLKFDEYKIKETFKNLKQYKLFVNLIGIFGFIIYVPIIKKVISRYIQNRLDINKLAFYENLLNKHLMTRSGHIELDDTEIAFKNDIKLLKRRISVNKLNKKTRKFGFL